MPRQDFAKQAIHGPLLNARLLNGVRENPVAAIHPASGRALPICPGPRWNPRTFASSVKRPRTGLACLQV